MSQARKLNSSSLLKRLKTLGLSHHDVCISNMHAVHDGMVALRLQHKLGILDLACVKFLVQKARVFKECDDDDGSSDSAHMSHAWTVCATATFHAHGCSTAAGKRYTHVGAPDLRWLRERQHRCTCTRCTGSHVPRAAQTRLM